MKGMKLRLAMREEGAFWNAYIAETGTMRGALLIGCIPMAAVRHNFDLKMRFMGVMQEVMADAIKGVTGSDVSNWLDARTAPESERGGHA